VTAYSYVRPEELAESDPPSGQPIGSLGDLLAFIEKNAEDLDEPFTFVVDRNETLLLAPRR
jgi:hypothetical protein